MPYIFMLVAQIYMSVSQGHQHINLYELFGLGQLNLQIIIKKFE